MNSRWYVDRDNFYTKYPLNIVGEPYYSESYSVTFFNADISSDIIQIHTFTGFETDCSKKKIIFSFVFSPRHAKKIKRCIKSAIDEFPHPIERWENSNFEKSLTFASYLSFADISLFLRDMNRLYGDALFSEDLIAEFDQMADFIVRTATHQPTHNRQYKCRFPQLPKESRKLFIKDKYSRNPLFDYIISNVQSLKDKKTAKGFASLLAEGVDPNETHRKLRLRALYVAVKIAQEEGIFYPMDLLLFYGANPLERDAFSEYSLPHSALDLALQYGNANIFSRITATLQTPQKSPRYTFSEFVTELRGRYLRSTVQVHSTENLQHVDTLSISLSKLEKRDKELEKRILKLGATTFEYTPDPGKFERMMLEDINAPDRLVEMLSDKTGEDIGFSLYGIYRVRNTLVWYCSLSLMTGNLRSSGIMSVLCWQNAYALQMLYPSETVAVHYLAIHPNSFKLVLDAHMHIPKKPFWPKYRTSLHEETVQVLLRKISVLPNSRHENAAPACYVDGQLTVKEPNYKPTPQQTFINDILYQYFLDEPHHNNNTKAAPILFFISDDFFQDFLEQASRIGINIKTQLNMYCLYLREFLQLTQLLQPALHLPPINSIKNGYLLFWRNESVSSNKQHLLAYQGIPSKI